jgi:hypothetical protein
MEAMFKAVWNPVPLGERRQRMPSTYMEIGADKGGGLWAWLWAFPSIERVIACEIRGTPYDRVFEEAFPHVQFLWLPESSLKGFVILDVQKSVQDRGIDVLFIDGDKADWGFRKDFDAYRPLVRKGGTVFLHDITDKFPRGPGQVWDQLHRGEVFDSWIMDEIIDIGEVEPALAKQERGEPLTSHEGWLCHWKGRSCGVGVIRV